MDRTTSEQLFEQAKRIIPGGVNSPVRAFRSVGGSPVFMNRASGAYLWDADGNKYIDYVGSWGPFILGHSHPTIVEAISKQLEKATSFGAPTELEIELAELVHSMMPNIEMLRMVNSGTEATMSAIRLARAYTNREKIIKFEGCYHGHGDSFLIKAGSGVLTLGAPDSPGVTRGTANDTLNARFNDIASVESLINANLTEIAAIIVEPIGGNMGVVPPQANFLQDLRNICTRHGIVLIFDEVMTGFRVALGGAQTLYNIQPDITTLGKIIGGGLPVGVYGGKREIMQLVAPSGSVYQAGTLSGNPLVMAAGIATLKILRDENPYPLLEKKAKHLSDSVARIIEDLEIAASQTRVGSMMCLFFTKTKVVDYASAVTSRTEYFAKYFNAMLDSGIYLAASQYEAMFISAAHTDDDIERTIEMCKLALMQVQKFSL